MKQLKVLMKAGCASLMCASVVPAAVYGAQEGQWVPAGSQWTLMESSGDLVKNQWKKISGVWYSFDGQGVMRTGWYREGNSWYYFDQSGAMRTGWMRIHGNYYFFAPGGEMKTGWIKSGNHWYYMNPADGEMKTG